MNETNGIVPKQNTNVAVASTTRLKDMWTSFEDNKSKNGTFVHFNDYRYSLGGRGIWGTKIFFRALVELNFLVECTEDSNSVGKYCPSDYAKEKYGDMFRYDKSDKVWGLSQEHLVEFDSIIFPPLIATARKLEIVYAKEKKRKDRARYDARKSLEVTNQKVDIGVSI